MKKRGFTYILMLWWFVSVLTEPGMAEQESGDRKRAVNAIGGSNYQPDLAKIAGNYHLLSFGINHYKKPIDFTDLETAVNGANTIADVFLNEYQFFSPANTHVYLNNEATRSAIVDGIYRFSDGSPASNVSSNDSLIIYFAGHGHTNDTESYWIPYDADPKKISSWVSTSDIKSALRSAIPRHVFIISDSCFSGGIFRSGPSFLETMDLETLLRSYTKKTRVALTSGAMEPVADGGSNGQSVFTHFLLETLRNPKKSWITPMEIHAEVFKPVMYSSPVRQRPHWGQVPDTLSQLGEFALFRKTDIFIPEICLPEMVWIPQGKFMMGSPIGEEGSDIDELLHEVTITEFFAIGKYEVTQEQWECLMGENPSYFKGAGPQAPVENVSWDDIQEYLKRLNEREQSAGRLPTGYVYALPTEAQWEYACRAGTTGATYSSDPWKILGMYNAPSLDAIAWYGGNSGVSYSGAYDVSSWPGKQYKHNLAGTHPVGEKQPNAFGLYDMLGNVWEWCEDRYDDYPSGPVSDPVGPASGSSRVFRGGSWYYGAPYCRSANRGRRSPSIRHYGGFRLSLRSASVR